MTKTYLKKIIKEELRKLYENKKYDYYAVEVRNMSSAIHELVSFTKKKDAMKADSIITKISKSNNEEDINYMWNKIGDLNSYVDTYEINFREIKDSVYDEDTYIVNYTSYDVYL